MMLKLGTAVHQHDSRLFCKQHAPAVTATTVTDSVSMEEARNAPKKTAEGIGSVQKSDSTKKK